MKRAMIAACILVFAAASTFAVDLSGEFSYYLDIPLDGSAFAESSYDSTGLFSGDFDISVTADNYSVSVSGDADGDFNVDHMEGVLEVDLTGALAEADIELPADVTVQIGNDGYTATGLYKDPNSTYFDDEGTQGATAIGASIGLDMFTLEVGADMLSLNDGNAATPIDIVAGLVVAPADGVKIAVNYDTASEALATSGKVDVEALADTPLDALALTYGVNVDFANSDTVFGVCLDAEVEKVETKVWYEYNNSGANEHEIAASFDYAASDVLSPYASIACTDLAAFATSVEYSVGATYTLGGIDYTAELEGDTTAAPTLSLGLDIAF